MVKKESNINNQKEFSKMSINWYPGHMAKTMRQIEEDLKLVDLVIEILDARIPISSQNPDVRKLISKKKKIVILNKSDLASDIENKKWVDYFKKNNQVAILCNSNTGLGTEKLVKEIRNLMASESEKASEKGRVGKIIRGMIIGIPNVGKSSFINRIANKVAMEVGNKPGVTKQKKWIRLDNNIELLDTPGVLWPKFDNEEIALNLSYTGTIKTEILDVVELAYNLTKKLVLNNKSDLIEKYKLDKDSVDVILKSNQLEENEKIVEIMNLIGRTRGAIARGNTIDLDKTSKIILDDFKNGRIGKITLEKVEE